MEFRKAMIDDLDQIEAIYDRIHDQEEQGLLTTGWLRGIYPVRGTAEAAVVRGDLFVGEEEGRIVGSMILNQLQVDSYVEGNWAYPCKDEEVMVMHTLTIDPLCANQGFGAEFVEYYEAYAYKEGCKVLRMDTNARNKRARAMYGKRGYQEVGCPLCDFFGIPDIKLVLLEKPVPTRCEHFTDEKHSWDLYNIRGGHKPDYVLIQPVSAQHDLEIMAEEAKTLASMTKVGIWLVAFYIENWNQELSPWEAPAVFGKETFGDGAQDTWKFIEKSVLSSLQTKSSKMILGGYSLAGLFALWVAAGNVGIDGVAAASPSVWFPDWISYAEEHPIAAKAVALSLGDKESKTKNPLMATVGACIVRQQALLEEQGVSCRLEWNPGNHFKEPVLRMAKAFAACIEMLESV